MTNKVGRIAFRTEGNWWVARYALPDSMNDALELGRIQMAIVKSSMKRKDAFMGLIQEYVAEIVPAFDKTEVQQAPEHERSGRG